MKTTKLHLYCFKAQHSIKLRIREIVPGHTSLGIIQAKQNIEYGSNALVPAD